MVEITTSEHGVVSEAHQAGEEVAYTRDPCKEAQITAALVHELSTLLQMPPWQVSQFCVALVCLAAPKFWVEYFKLKVKRKQIIFVRPSPQGPLTKNTSVFELPLECNINIQKGLFLSYSVHNVIQGVVFRTLFLPKRAL